jgi:hypothetical protein
MVAIWIVFSIISAIAKKQEEEKRKRVRQQIESGLPPAPPQMPPVPEVFQPRMQRAPAQRVPAQQVPVQRLPPQRAPLRAPMRPSPQQPQQPPRKQKRPKQERVSLDRQAKRSVPRQAPPPIPTARSGGESTTDSMPPPTKQDITATEIGNRDVRSSRPAVNAAALHRWLRPATLRQQFMLTEVLQPPIALRPERQ